MKNSARKTLLSIYHELYLNYGPQHWWPADSRIEVIVGAILTQNTAWINVEKAIRNLKREGVLCSPGSFLKIPRSRLARMIRPSGYYNIKSQRIKNFFEFLHREFKDRLDGMKALDTASLRKMLLGVNGIGPETCDSILLYALDRPVFVVDAYTKRIFARHGLIKEDASYDEIQSFFSSNLPVGRRLFNEYHALIVRLEKYFCRKRPDCLSCPINYLATGKVKLYNKH